MDPQESCVLWVEADWRCEYSPGFAGHGRLVLYQGHSLVAAESTPTGVPAALRGEVLRQRVLRGDVSANGTK